MFKRRANVEEANEILAAERVLDAGFMLANKIFALLVANLNLKNCFYASKETKKIRMLRT